MSSIESLGSASAQPRSASAAALQQRLAQPLAAAPAAKVELQAAVRQPNASETARLMQESRPQEPPPKRASLPSPASTAAYLIEMRLSQELAAVQEDIEKL